MYRTESDELPAVMFVPRQVAIGDGIAIWLNPIRVYSDRLQISLEGRFRLASADPSIGLGSPMDPDSVPPVVLMAEYADGAVVSSDAGEHLSGKPILDCIRASRTGQIARAEYSLTPLPQLSARLSISISLGTYGISNTQLCTIDAQEVAEAAKAIHTPWP